MKNLITLSVCLFAFFQIQAQENFSDLFTIEIKGQGKPIILIPGLSCSGEVWKETVEKLSPNYECHILTLGGFAGIEAFPGSDTLFLPKIKKGIIKYIQEKDLQKPTIIGHSLGGFTALSIASTHSGLLSKIVIVDSYPFFSAAMNPNATEEMMKPQAQMMKTMMMNQDETTFKSQQRQSLPTMVTGAEDVEKILNWSLNSDRATVAQAMYELMTTDLRQEAGSVDCPILVLGAWYAAKDYGITQEMVKNNYQQQFSKAEDVQIFMANTAKHFIMLDEFDWFINNLNTFLK